MAKRINKTERVETTLSLDGFVEPVTLTTFEVKVGKTPVRFETRREATAWKRALKRFARVVKRARTISQEIVWAGQMTSSLNDEQREAYRELVAAANNFNASLNETIDYFG